MDDLGNGCDIVFDQISVARFQGADIDDHVEFLGSYPQRFGSFKTLHRGVSRAERKANRGSHLDWSSSQRGTRQTDPRRVYTHGYKTEEACFFAQTDDLRACGLRFQKRVIDMAGSRFPAL